jgi:hypothetical protein
MLKLMLTQQMAEAKRLEIAPRVATWRASFQ